MRIMQVHNYHWDRGGAEMVYETAVQVLREHGHRVITLARDNRTLTGVRARVLAAGAGIYSFQTKSLMRRMLHEEQPELVHVHNIYPLFSPSILEACCEAGVPVAMSVHDFKITCPTGQHLRAGSPCELCLHGREHWCVLTNCRGSMPMSIAYAVRAAAARRWGWVVRNVRVFLPPTEFVRRQLVKAGFSEDRIIVLPNAANLVGCGGAGARTDGQAPGCYVAYLGRISPEKGIETLIEAARQTELPVQIAGACGAMPHVVAGAPPNVRFVGWLERDQLSSFLAGARFLVAPSICYETFGMVAAEAMACGRPVIAARIGGLQEVVEHGVTGLHFEPRNASDLATAMRKLWEDPETAMRLGRQARVKAERDYSRSAFYHRLMAAYDYARAAA